MNVFRFVTMVLVISLYGMNHAVAAHHWETTEFEVFIGKPYKYNDSFYRAQLAAGIDPDTEIELCQEHNQRTCDHAVATLQSYLHDAAVALQDIGFADPTANGIDSIITDYNGRKKVRVYMFDFVAAGEEGKLAFFTNPCDRVTSESILGSFDLGLDYRRVMILNSRNMFSGGVIGAPGLQTAAHELFHTVQFVSKLRMGQSRCKVSKWITEGTADAVGFYLAKSLRNISTKEWDKMVGDLPGFIKPWGGRYYWKTLSAEFPKRRLDYQASSFWRHLAEWDRAKGKGQDHPGSPATPEQYHYMVDLFSRPYGTSGVKNDLAWLDSWMKSYTTMGGGLAPIYAQFAASIANHMADPNPPAGGGTPPLKGRIPKIEGLANGERESRWLRFLFEPCERVTLDQLRPSQPVRVSINPVAARCISVDIKSAISGPVALVIENSDLSNVEQKQVRIGAIGGQLVQIPDVRIAKLPATDAGTSYALWQFLAKAGEENIFVFSNVASKARGTVAVNGEFKVSIPAWGSTMTNTQPAGPTRSAPAGQPKTRKAVTAHQKSLRNNPTTNSMAAVMAGADHQPATPGCTAGMQSKNLCGPQLSISLMLDYGTVPGQGPAAAAGGTLKQMGQLNMYSPGDEAQTAALVQQMSSNSRGSVITLSIPVVDYDFSGAVSNARIDVLGNEGRTYQAIQLQPDENGQYPPNGVVNIEEYSPHMLRGTFRASLVDSEAMKHASRQNPTLPVSETVEGHFVVPAPWRGNTTGIETDAASSFMTGAREDMMDFLLKMPEDMRRSMFTGDKLDGLCQLGFEDEQLSSLGIVGSCASSGVGTAARAQHCDCRCEVYEQMRKIPLCQSQCGAAWQTAQCEVKKNATTEKDDAEAGRYAAELQSLGVAGSMYDIQMHAFRAGTPELRAKMWNDLEIVREALADEGLRDLHQARLGNKPSKDYDEETLRYKAALEAAGKSEVEVNGFVSMFWTAKEGMRQVLWDDLDSQQQ